MQERSCAAEQLPARVTPNGSDVAHAPPVDSRFDEPLEIVAVLDDPGDRQRHARTLGHLDRFNGPLVRVDPPKEQEILARLTLEVELAQIDPVVDRGNVVEVFVPVGVADRHVVTAPVVFLEDRHDQL